MVSNIKCGSGTQKIADVSVGRLGPFWEFRQIEFECVLD